MSQLSSNAGWLALFILSSGIRVVIHRAINLFDDGSWGQDNVLSRSLLICLVMTGSLLTVSGCGPDGPKPVNQKDVVPVIGTVHVDGEPKRGVKVRLAPNPMPADRRVALPSIGRTDDEGKFAFTTYYQDDGVPVGEYHLLFELDLNPSGTAQDFFRGKYSIPAQSTHTLSVKGDEEGPIDLGVIELTGP